MALDISDEDFNRIFDEVENERKVKNFYGFLRNQVKADVRKALEWIDGRGDLRHQYLDLIADEPHRIEAGIKVYANALCDKIKFEKDSPYLTELLTSNAPDVPAPTSAPISTPTSASAPAGGLSDREIERLAKNTFAKAEVELTKKSAPSSQKATAQWLAYLPKDNANSFISGLIATIDGAKQANRNPHQKTDITLEITNKEFNAADRATITRPHFSRRGFLKTAGGALLTGTFYVAGQLAENSAAGSATIFERDAAGIPQPVLKPPEKPPVEKDEKVVTKVGGGNPFARPPAKEVPLPGQPAAVEPPLAPKAAERLASQQTAASYRTKEQMYFWAKIATAAVPGVTTTCYAGPHFFRVAYQNLGRLFDDPKLDGDGGEKLAAGLLELIGKAGYDTRDINLTLTFKGKEIGRS